ncbi:MAG: peptide chain release factor-like protein [Fibrobacter sp.]|nr:peptide chain release factor-like protein [Fibrobacter sp.]
MNMNCIVEQKMVNDTGYQLPPTDDLLLGECIVNTFRAGGKGGQHVNKTESAVRLLHKPTGTVVTCSNERSQYLNKMQCLRNLRKKIENKLKKLPPRIPTKITQAAKRRRVENKLLTAAKKELRRKVLRDEF